MKRPGRSPKRLLAKCPRPKREAVEKKESPPGATRPQHSGEPGSREIRQAAAFTAGPLLRIRPIRARREKPELRPTYPQKTSKNIALFAIFTGAAGGLPVWRTTRGGWLHLEEGGRPKNVGLRPESASRLSEIGLLSAFKVPREGRVIHRFFLF